jgi:hypothetical protein
VFATKALRSPALQCDGQTSAHLADDRNHGLYARLNGEFEPLTMPRLTLNTNQSLTECVRQAEKYLELISHTSRCGQSQPFAPQRRSWQLVHSWGGASTRTNFFSR